MTTNNSTSSNNIQSNQTEESRTGAMACMEALRKFVGWRSAIFNDGEEQTTDEYLRYKKAAILNVVSLAGELSPRAAGFMETLVEYIYECDEGVIADLDKWKPDAAMTEEERAAYRDELCRVDLERIAYETKIFTPEEKESFYKIAFDQAKLSIGQMFHSAEQFKNRCAMTTTKIVPILVDGYSGYSFADSAMEKINLSLSGLSEVVRDGEVLFSTSVYEQKQRELVREAFKKHLPFWPSEPEMDAYIQRVMEESALVEVAHV
jgi:hypothetical protein